MFPTEHREGGGNSKEEGKQSCVVPRLTDNLDEKGW